MARGLSSSSNRHRRGMSDDLESSCVRLEIENRLLKRQLQLVCEVGAITPFEADREGNWVHVDDRWYALTGNPPTQALGLQWLNAIHPDDRHHVCRAWLVAVRERHELALRCRLVHVDGGWEWVRLHARAMDSRDLGAQESASDDDTCAERFSGVVVSDTAAVQEPAQEHVQKPAQEHVQKPAQGPVQEPRVANERFTTDRVLHMVRHPLVVLDRTLCIKIANSAFYELFGVPVGERESVSIDALPERKCNGQTLREHVEDMLHKGHESAELLLPFDLSNNLSRTLQVGISRLHQGSDFAILLDFQDVTEQAHEQKLHRDILSSVPDAIIETDLSFRIKGWNRGAETLYGWPAEDVLGRTIRDVIVMQHQSLNPIPALDQVIADGAWTGDVVQCRRDGTSVCVLSSMSLLRDPYGAPVGLVAINRDITDRKRAETLLAERAHQQQMVAELGLYSVNRSPARVMERSVAMVASVLDADFCEVFELAPGLDELRLHEGVGWPQAAIGHETTSATVDSCEGYALRTDEPVFVEDWRTERRFRASSLLADQKVVSSVSVVIPGIEEPYGVLGAHCIDEHGFSRNDANFLQAVANIIAESLVRAEITAQLSHANRLNTVGKLAVSLTHEFGTPLNVIAVYAKMMMRGQMSGEEQRQGLQAIAEQVKHATRLVRQVLDFSRQTPSSPSVQLVGAVVGRTVDMLRPIARKHRVTLSVTEPEGEIAVQIAEQTLQQVLSNLIMNAIDAQPTGGRIDIDITIPNASYLSGRSYVCIAVADQGPGVPSHLYEQIFTAFFTTKQAGRGTGLGLSVSKQLMEEAGGYIDLPRHAGPGARFLLYLPNVLSPEPTSRPAPF